MIRRAMVTFQKPRPNERMIEVEEAQERVLAEVEPGEAESVPLAEAHGRVLRETIVAAADAPAVDNSAMDGYAVRAADVRDASEESPVALPVTGDVPAGRPPSARVEPGTAMRIMTGAFVPGGAVAVVQVEWTDAGRDVVSIRRAVEAGSNVRRRGEDMRAGDRVLGEGARIGPAEIAILTANRRREVRVSRAPSVAILSTGDELQDSGAAPEPGKIVNTNAPLLAALVREAGGRPRVLANVPDDLDATVAALADASAADLVLTTGGVSAGAFDYVEDALDALGAETKFRQVAMKPGKPVVLSRLRGKLCFGLPGNPASCFVAFHLFVRPALQGMLGCAERFPPVATARLTAPLKGAPDRRVYYRARADWEDGALIARPLATQGSGALTSMAGANALVVVAPGERVEAGSLVRVVLL